jgi:hypothetical protein
LAITAFLAPRQYPRHLLFRVSGGRTSGARRKQMIVMSAVMIAAILAVVIVVAALVIGLIMVLRRRRLRQSFGPEYDRLVGQRDSKLKAESELAGRERRVHGLAIQPLSDAARASYSVQWAEIQEQFVDTPSDAVASSQVLIAAVMSEMGYPADDREQVLSDLSVGHASALDRYRKAEGISRSAAAGTASTEDLRVAMIDYRALFRDLLGETADAGTRSTAADPVPASRADDAAAPDASDAQLAETQPGMSADDPVSDAPDQLPSRSAEGN